MCQTLGKGKEEHGEVSPAEWRRQAVVGGCIKFSTSRAKEERAEETQIPTTVDTPTHLAGPVTARENGYD